MAIARSLVGVVSLLLCVLFSQGAPAESRAVAFTDNPVKLTALVNQDFSIDLRTLLSEQGSGQLIWTAGAGIPAWLTLDSPNHRLFGRPAHSDAGSATFRLSVQEGENGAFTQVELSVPSPPVWADPLDLGIQQEGVAFSLDLKTKVTNPPGGTLTFSGNRLPSWLSLTSDGLLSGTPERPDVGVYSGVELTATGVGGASTGIAFGEVKKTVQPPKWQGNPITLENAFEDAPYEKPISGFASNFENTALEYTLLRGPDWLKLSANGTLFGTPLQSDVGSVSARVQLKTTIDGTVYDDVTEFKFDVQAVNDAPVWLSNPIQLPDAFHGQSYNQPLHASANDPDGDALSFSLVSGPAWAQLTADGVFVGTPQLGDVGAGEWIVQVSDGQLGAQATIRVTVVKSNEPPVWNPKPVVLSPNAKEDESYASDLSAFVSDPDGDALEFHLLNGPNWATVSSSGILMGTPKAGDVGLQKFSVRVTDNLSGSDVTDVIVEVEHTNHAPEWILNPIFLLSNEDEPFDASISQYARDGDAGDTLTFAALSGPAWATLSSQGVFSGTPDQSQVGDHTVQAQVTDSGGLTADVKIILRVINTNDAPVWANNPIVLPNAPERTLYTESLASHASDEDPGDVLVFSKVSGPDWAFVTSTGTVTGTPKRPHLGLNTLQVRVMDREMAFAVVEVQITVDKVNLAPRWRQSPLLLSDAYDGLEYQFDASEYAVDDDQDTLTFEKVAGPDWLFVATDGKLAGKPALSDVGDYTATLRVSDGQASADVEAQGTVIARNHAPIIQPDIVIEVKERATLKVDLDDAQYVQDIDGDDLAFEALTQLPDWAGLTSEGKLSLSPLHAHIGDHVVSLRVNDGEAVTEGDLTLRVLRDAQPPVWSEDPLRFTAKTNVAFSDTVADKASEVDGVALTFHKVSGPDWLSVSEVGVLSGTPTESHLGENSFVLEAKNDAVGTQVTVLIDVIPGLVSETFELKAKEDAPVDHLWVIDSSQYSWEWVHDVKCNIQTYFKGLGGLHHRNVILSSDIFEKDGKPQTTTPRVLNWDLNKLSDAFVSRVDAIYSNNCYNAPVWASHLFLQNIDTFVEEISPEIFFENEVPLEIMIATEQVAHFPKFAPTDGTFTPSKFAESFRTIAAQRGKPLTVHALLRGCPKLKETSGELGSVAPKDTYRTLVEDTGGTYTDAKCNYNVDKILGDLANNVRTRAQVVSNHTFTLGQTPLSVDTIEVQLGSTVLEGTQWTYEASNNTVTLKWTAIDLGGVTLDDVVVVRYRVNRARPVS